MTKNPSSHSPLKQHLAPIDGSPATVHLHANSIQSDYVPGMTSSGQKHSHNSMLITQEPLSCHVPMQSSNRLTHVSMANSTFHSNSVRTLPRTDHKVATVNVINAGHNTATLGRHTISQEMRV